MAWPTFPALRCKRAMPLSCEVSLLASFSWRASSPLLSFPLRSAPRAVRLRSSVLARASEAFPAEKTRPPPPCLTAR